MRRKDGPGPNAPGPCNSDMPTGSRQSETAPDGCPLERAILDAGGVTRSAPRGQTAFQWQGSPSAFVFLKSGSLSIHFRTGNTNLPWAECRTVNGQDCMPVTAAILSGQQISARAVCKLASTWIELPPARLVLLVHGQPDFRQALFASHARRLPVFFARVATRHPVGIDQRIAGWLLSHAQANTVHATHSQIANDLLTAREVVSRRLRDFASRGWIEQKRGRILIDAPAALLRASTGAFFLGQKARDDAPHAGPV